jgi:hypothetical protein
MPANYDSLLAGRNRAPLTEQQILRASATFNGLDRDVPARYEDGARTRFRVVQAESEEVAEVVFGPDILPGSSVVDDNSLLGLTGAAAHECTHFHRWFNGTELPEEELVHIDEAMTSLEAILRYTHLLGNEDCRELVRDALQRLRLFVAERRNHELP